MLQLTEAHVIAPQVNVLLDPIFRFPAVIFPAAIEDAAIFPII